MATATHVPDLEDAAAAFRKADAARDAAVKVARSAAAEAVASGTTIKDTAAAFGVTRNTIYSWISDQ